MFYIFNKSLWVVLKNLTFLHICHVCDWCCVVFCRKIDLRCFVAKSVLSQFTCISKEKNWNNNCVCGKKTNMRYVWNTKGNCSKISSSCVKHRLQNLPEIQINWSETWIPKFIFFFILETFFIFPAENINIFISGVTHQSKFQLHGFFVKAEKNLA